MFHASAWTIIQSCGLEKPLGFSDLVLHISLASMVMLIVAQQTLKFTRGISEVPPESSYRTWFSLASSPRMAFQNREWPIIAWRAGFSIDNSLKASEHHHHHHIQTENKESHGQFMKPYVKVSRKSGRQRSLSKTYSKSCHSAEGELPRKKWDNPSVSSLYECQFPWIQQLSLRPPKGRLSKKNWGRGQ